MLLVLAVLAIVLVRNQPWQLLAGYDQAKQAHVAVVMAEEGRWFYPELPTGLPGTKPPLMGWLSAALHALPGCSWTLAWRLPPFLACLGLLWLLGRVGARIAGGWGAYLALAVFGLNMLTPRIATLVRTDMLLALEVTAAVALILDRVRGGGPWTSAHRAALAGLLALSCMTKGPVIYTFVLPQLLVWRWMQRRRGEPDRAWPGWWPILLPVAVFAIWLAMGCLLDDRFFRMVVLREFGNNFAAVRLNDEGRLMVDHLHRTTVVNYLLKLLHRLLPWSAALLLLVCWSRQVRRALWAEEARRWIVLSVLVPLLAMSLVPGKRADRIYPVVPSIALLAACTWPLVASRRAARVLHGLTIGAALIWGGYTLANRLAGDDAERRIERARLDFCNEVREAAGKAGGELRIVGPVKEEAQSLMVYLGMTRWIGREDAGAELARGNPVVAREEDLAGRPVRILVRQREGDYALAVSAR